MRVSNKAKAIKKANEYLELLRTMYSRDDKAYLYIYTWVDCATEEIISELNVNRRDGWWHPRTDWFKLMNDLDDAIRCNRISKEIKENALLILSNPELMKIYEELRKCFN